MRDIKSIKQKNIDLIESHREAIKEHKKLLLYCYVASEWGQDFDSILHASLEKVKDSSFVAYILCYTVVGPSGGESRFQCSIPIEYKSRAFGVLNSDWGMILP